MNKTLIWYSPFVLILVLLIYFSATESTKIPLTKEFDFSSTEMTITVHFEDVKTIREAFVELNDVPPERASGVIAFAVLYPNSSTCVIYSTPILSQHHTLHMETLGHELLHCIYGRWHSGNEDLSKGY